MTFADCFFCPTISPNPTDTSFAIIDDKEKQQIFPFNMLLPENVSYFYLKN